MIITTAEQAIKQSIHRDEIVHVDDVGDIRLDLLVECDDNTETDCGVEYWGGDDGAEWRVHVRLASACARE
jgi:hypothetical protein